VVELGPRLALAAVGLFLLVLLEDECLPGEPLSEGSSESPGWSEPVGSPLSRC
jgi:hypothetical protein